MEVEEIDARRTRIQKFLNAVSITSRLRSKNPQGIFSPHIMQHFLNSMGEATEIIVNKLGIDIFSALDVSRRVFSVYLDKQADFLTDVQRLWFANKLILQKFASSTRKMTEEGTKRGMLRNLSMLERNDADLAVTSIFDCCDMLAQRMTANDSMPGFKANEIKYAMAAYVSRFYGLMQGSDDDRRKALMYYLDREVQNYMTEEGLEIQRRFRMLAQESLSQ